MGAPVIDHVADELKRERVLDRGAKLIAPSRSEAATTVMWAYQARSSWRCYRSTPGFGPALRQTLVDPRARSDDPVPPVVDPGTLVGHQVVTAEIARDPRSTIAPSRTPAARERLRGVLR